MQFSNTTSKAGIIQMIEQVTNLGDAAISGVTVKMAYFTNLVNDFLQLAHQYVRAVNKEWHFDDSNYTTFPWATTTIVDDQRDYTLPSTLQRVKQVEVLDASGKYYSLALISQDDPEFLNEKMQETAGKPSHYYLVGNTIQLYPKPDTAQVTAAAGLRVTMERTMDLFTVSDTTQEPGIDSAYHSILVYGPAYVWAQGNGVQHVANLAITMLGGFEGLTALLKKHYSDRNDDDPPIISRETKSYA